MKKIYFKLTVMVATLLMSVSVVLMSSYAWLVLSGNPVVTGIQVAIGGGNTILTAPDVRITDENGNTETLKYTENLKRAYDIPVNMKVKEITLIPETNWGDSDTTAIFSFDFRN